MTLRPSVRSGRSLRRLRTTLWPILETAGGAVAAWYLARLALGDRETGFAAIAAIICLGATLGEQRQRALELMGGVVLGVLIADLFVRWLGNEPPQVGVMVVLAMSAAVLVGGGPLLMTEAGVSAVIIGSTAASTLGLFPGRFIEALIGAAVAFGVHSLLFPPDPLLHVGRAANAVFGSLGRTLQDLAAALEAADREAAERALAAAREMDGDVRALSDALALGRETARSAPLRWPARAALHRQEEMSRHLDFAVRNTRVLARDTLRYLRAGGQPVPDVAAAIRDLAQATWALATAFEEPDTHDDPRPLALRAGARGTEAMLRHADFTLTQIAGQVRSTAADLVRAAHAAKDDPMADASTEEMLAEPRDPPADGAGALPSDRAE